MPIRHPRPLPASALLLLPLLLAAMSDSHISAQSPSPGKLTPGAMTAEVKTELRYWLYLPENYAASERVPLVLFLHGAGERGPDLEKVKVHGPPKLIGQGKQFPFMVVAPQCPQDSWWNAAELSGLLDGIERQHKVDSRRIYLTGLSMGGYGVWSLAMREPSRFAAIAPICGGGNSVQARYVTPLNIPTWCFHGAKDTAVPLSESQEMVEVVKRTGAEVKLTVYPDAGHDSWTASYDNPELYKWLLSHQRPEAENDGGTGARTSK